MKHVKKSMFISTVLMVVMLIAALSTATFAWYTSNNTAASKSTTVGAAQSNDANIGIGFYVGAQENEIEFFAMADTVQSQLKGNLNPVAPTTYYHEYSANNTVKQTLSDCYATSVKNNESNYVAGGVNDYNYRRIVQMTDAQIAKIRSQSVYTHDASATDTNGKYTKLTNLKEGSHFNGNYEHIYKVKMYAYNNGIAINAAGRPAEGNAITVSANYNYTVLDSAIEGTCYAVEAVYEIVSAAGEGIANAIAEVTTSTTKITQYCANQLLQQFNANYTPIAGTYLVMYYDYHVLPYTTTDVTSADARAEEVGYAGENAGVLNTTQHDIKAEAVINQPNTYPTTAISGSAVGITSISYDRNGFAYLYKTFEATTTYATTTNADNYASFAFNKASVNQLGYFKNSGNDAHIGGLWGGNATQGYNYNATNIDIGLVQGKAATSSAEATSTFYVTNNGTTPITHLRISLGATGDNANLLRVAVFRDGKYYGTLASIDETPTTFGTILEGGLASNMPKYKAYRQIDLGMLNFGPDYAAAFQLVAWFDGGGLNDQAAGKNCTFTLSFEASVGD